MIRVDHWYALAVGDRSSVDLVTCLPCHLIAAMINARQTAKANPPPAKRCPGEIFVAKTEPASGTLPKGFNNSWAGQFIAPKWLMSTP
jgi:hypothetical protein